MDMYVCVSGLCFILLHCLDLISVYSLIITNTSICCLKRGLSRQFLMGCCVSFHPTTCWTS